MGLKVDTIQNPTSATVNLTLDTSGNVTAGGNLTVSGTGNQSFGGNVGIGTTSPQVRLQIGSSSTSTQSENIDMWGALAGSNGDIGRLRFYNVNAFGNKIVAQVSGAREGNNYGGALVFSTGTQADTTLTERMRIDSSGIVTGTAGNLMLVQGTAQAATSGTSKLFSSIPSWASRVTVMFRSVVTSGASPLLIQLGSGSVTTTGYSSSASGASGSLATTASTAGFILQNNGISTESNHGVITISSLGSNIWASAGVLSVIGATNGNFISGGSIALAGALDRINITTVNGTDTFSSGTINIQYE